MEEADFKSQGQQTTRRLHHAVAEESEGRWCSVFSIVTYWFTSQTRARPEQTFAQLLPSAAHPEVWSHSPQNPTYCTFIQRTKPFPPLQGTIPLPQTDLLAGR